MKINFLEKLLGSGFYTGYIPFASGTFGSLAALILYFIPGFENPAVMILMISVFTLAGKNIADKFEAEYGKDPAECTIDEMIGMWITLLFIPKQLVFVVPAFVVWRIMDIVKPFPARRAEGIKGGWGIILDDIIAGTYSFIVVQLFIYFIRLIF